jgi:hypothetical protein
MKYINKSWFTVLTRLHELTAKEIGVYFKIIISEDGLNKPCRSIGMTTS